MIEKINLNNILFLDIETVPEYHNYRGLDNETQQLWEQKTQYQRKDEVSAEDFYERAYFDDNLKDMILGLDIKEKPGQSFKYLSGATQLLAMC